MAKSNVTAKERVQHSVQKVAEALETLTKAFESTDETLKSDAASKTFAFVSSMVSESHQRAALSFNVSKARSGQFDLDDETLVAPAVAPVIRPIGIAPAQTPNVITLPYSVPPHIVLGEDGKPEGRLAGSKVEKVSAALRKVDPDADFLED
ncbi:hypothetical protein [Phyllobacterium myrsinacearum]|uniref:Uncharacterized protein n=1 Tax=Phyllobacterium myrsinacearum TaxID=28101 RepID=A0A839EZH6_9HYPH|nr:hypothetical protein [Phyllobacterium myrsinacearum]MBA8881777.1 hypothetical protein [Phyllobacterium myrsinacearum]